MSDEKKTTAAAKKAAAVQEEAVVYCGPTIKGLAPQYTVFLWAVCPRSWRRRWRQSLC